MSNWRRQKNLFIVITFFLCSWAHAGKLHKAIIENRIDDALAIIKATTDSKTLNVRCRGLSPIHLAAQKGFLTVVKELVNHETEITKLCEMGYTAIQLALIHGYDDIVEFLQEKGAVIESDFLFQQLATTTNELPRYDDSTKPPTDEQIREILLSDSYFDIFAYIYPLLMDRDTVFKKINSLLDADKIFIEQFQQEQIITKMNSEQLIHRIHSKRFHSWNEFIDKKDQSAKPKEEGDTKKSPKEPKEDAKNIRDSFLKDEIGSRQPSNESFSRDEIERKKINSQTSSREELGSKKISQTSLDSRNLLSNSDSLDLDLENIVSVDDSLSPAEIESLKTDIQSLKEKLKKHKPLSHAFLRDMLKSFAADDFRAGIPSANALLDLAILLKKIDIHNDKTDDDTTADKREQKKVFARLERQIWSALWTRKGINAYHQERREKLRLVLSSPKIKQPKAIVLPRLKELWNNYSAKELAHIFTKNDVDLFQKISLENLYEQIAGKNPKEVKRVINHNNARTNFFSFLIVSENNKNERVKIVRKLLKLNAHFRRLNNFFGLGQVANALSQTDIERLITWTEEKNLYKKYKKYQDLVTPLSNFKNYRNIIKDIPENEPTLPFLPVFTKDFEVASTLKVSTLNGFIHMGTAVRTLMIYIKSCSHYKFETSIIKDFRKIPLIPEEVISEFSSAQKPFFVARAIPKNPLNEWSCSQFTSFLYQKNSNEMVLNILHKFIWSGKDLVRMLCRCKTMEAKFTLLDSLGIDTVTQSLLFQEAESILQNFARRSTDNTKASTQRIRANRSATPEY